MTTSQKIAVVTSASWLLLVPLSAQTTSVSQDQSLHINQIQVIGTHNSYHAGLAPGEAALLRQQQPRLYQAIDYRHPPLDQQLSAGVRQIELDIFPDPQGGRFTEGETQKPGFKVMHLQDLDQRSTCLTLIHCLAIVRTWSRQHPEHLPVFILVDCKTARIAAPSGGVTFESMTPVLFDALQGEILSVFPPGEIITPDQVRGAHATLLEAISAGGWPTLAAARGKVIFLLDNLDLASVYDRGNGALRGRILFPDTIPGTPDSAFVEVNHGPRGKIEALVRQGYLVRTRADADTMEARSGSTFRRDEALASGAQLVSTDYPASEPAAWTGYSVSFAQGSMARCNPINQPLPCRNDLLEPPAQR
jgi:Phosphoinositide phospholipase C, Ca2+-dependent